MTPTNQRPEQEPQGPTHHGEVERKYDVATDTPVPDLTEVAGVASVAEPVELDQVATYYDTADLRLQRARITLRRRTGGLDDGWHAKLPGGPDRRVELHLPLSDDVPGELLNQLQAHLRDAPVRPVAELRTRRQLRRLLADDGAVLAELCDDRVHADSGLEDGMALEWREWELELVEGPTDLLDAAEVVLFSAGATPAAVASKVARVLGRAGRAQDAQGSDGDDWSAPAVMAAYVREHLQRLQEQDRLLRAGDHEGVHQLRVAARRLRSALSTYRPLLVMGATEDLRDDLRWLGGVLAGARDAQVMRAHLAVMLDEQPAELVLGPVRRRVDEELSTTFQAGRSAALEVLDGERYLGLLARLETFVDEPPLAEEAVGASRPELARILEHELRRVRKRRRAVAAATTSDERDHALHEVRKAAKRLRYAAESARPVFGGRAKKLAKRAKAVQTVLGEHQDAVVARQTLRELGVRAHLAGENGFTFGRLHALEETRAAHLRQQYAEAVTALPGKHLTEWLDR